MRDLPILGELPRSGQSATQLAVAGPQGTSTDDLPARQRGLWLALILASAAAIRFYRLAWGLPGFVFNDTLMHFAQPAATIAATGDWVLERFVHPPLYPYVLSVFTLIWTTLTGTTIELAGQQARFDTGMVTMGSRFVTALLGVVLVWLIYLVARRLLESRAALWAAAFFALSPVHVLESHRVNVDTPMLVLAMLSAYCGIAAYQKQDLRSLWLSFALAAAAGATKYTGLYAGTLPLWFLLRWPAPAREKLRMFFTAGGISLAALALLMSPVLLNLQVFIWEIRGLFYIAMFEGAPGQDLSGNSWVFAPYLYLLFVGMPFILGWPVMIASLLGCTYLALRDRPALAVLAAATLPYFILQGAAETATPRYYLPLAPYAAIAAGVAMREIVAYGRYAGAALAAGVVLYTAILAGSQVARIGGAPQAEIGDKLSILVNAKRNLGISLRSYDQPKLVVAYPIWASLAYDSIRTHVRARGRKSISFPPYLRTPGDAIDPREALRQDRRWIRSSGVDAIVVPSRWEALGARQQFLGRERQFYESLLGERLGLRKVADARTTYFTQSWYEWADPGLATIWTAGIAGYKLYVRDDLLAALPPPP